MDNQRDSGRLAGLALTAAIIILCLFASLVVYQLGQKQLELQKENAALKAEIRRWQKAAIPALKARGWDTEEKDITSLLPIELEVALNPCIDKDGSWIVSQECLSAVPPPYNPNKAAIKIVLAR